MSTPAEQFRVFPVFLLVDVSASMAGGPIEALNTALPDLKLEMESNPTVGEIARIALVTFSDEVRTQLPLCHLAEVAIPDVLVEGGTDLAEAFRGLRAAIDRDLAELARGTPIYRPEVVSFGFGDANRETLRRIATRFAFEAKHDDPAVQVREIMNTLIGSIRASSASLADPSQVQGLHIEAPTEHFTALPALST
ncbi:VWA domain-containing protein [Micromonospora sp. NBC_01699]|uniref:vWA domain-containing protein n=1 Tax=Micromonospora sp. NBC_01699 TaxID=2975984 RepID=UPI002E2F1E62|nr:VWA domain-containing protein [Micromonospora sp. NBC_01699]